MSSSDSYLTKGITLKMGRTSQAMPPVIMGAKIACLDFDYEEVQGANGVRRVVVNNPAELGGRPDLRKKESQEKDKYDP